MRNFLLGGLERQGLFLTQLGTVTGFLNFTTQILKCKTFAADDDHIGGLVHINHRYTIYRTQDTPDFFRTTRSSHSIHFEFHRVMIVIT